LLTDSQLQYPSSLRDASPAKSFTPLSPLAEEERAERNAFRLPAGIVGAAPTQLPCRDPQSRAERQSRSSGGANVSRGGSRYWTGAGFGFGEEALELDLLAGAVDPSRSFPASDVCCEKPLYRRSTRQQPHVCVVHVLFLSKALSIFSPLVFLLGKFQACPTACRCRGPRGRSNAALTAWRPRAPNAGDGSKRYVCFISLDCFWRVRLDLLVLSKGEVQKRVEQGSFHRRSAVAVSRWRLHRLLARTTAPRPQLSTLPPQKTSFGNAYQQSFEQEKMQRRKTCIWEGVSRVCYMLPVLLVWCCSFGGLHASLGLTARHMIASPNPLSVPNVR
jgi:hypothetical protein